METEEKNDTVQMYIKMKKLARKKLAILELETGLSRTDVISNAVEMLYEQLCNNKQ